VPGLGRKEGSGRQGQCLAVGNGPDVGQEVGVAAEDGRIALGGEPQRELQRALAVADHDLPGLGQEQVAHQVGQPDGQMVVRARQAVQLVQRGDDCQDAVVSRSRGRLPVLELAGGRQSADAREDQVAQLFGCELFVLRPDLGGEIRAVLQDFFIEEHAIGTSGGIPRPVRSADRL